MKIFITGSTGFMGGYLLRKLMSLGHEVIVLVRDKNKLKISEAKVIVGEISDKELLIKALQGIEIVYHLAAIRYEWGYSQREYYQANVLGTQSLLEAAHQNKIKKFIYCSTVFVGGYNQKIPADETNPYKAESLYGQSKIEAEKLVISFCQKNSLPFTVIRPAVTYGPKDRGMFYKICHLIQDGKFMVIGNGYNKLHLCYINDLIDGFILALNRGKGGTYIIADERPISLIELVQKISKLLNKKVPSVRIPKEFAKIVGMTIESFYKIFSIKKEPLMTTNKVALLTDNQYFNIEKAKKELGYQPKVDYDEGIVRTIKWYRENNYL